MEAKNAEAQSKANRAAEEEAALKNEIAALKSRNSALESKTDDAQ